MTTPDRLIARLYRPRAIPGTRIVRSSIDAYDQLGHWHYRAGRPATRVLVLEAIRSGETAGVLVVSMPVLNADWRSGHWPDLNRPTTKSDRAKLLNASVRTISRVVIDPRFRGLGIATALVRAYLASPITRHTEALSAMGAASPFFERAGMRVVIRTEPKPLSALRAALETCNSSPELLLLHPDRLMRRGKVRTAVVRWANSGKGRTLLRKASRREQAIAAASTLLARPIAYVHETRSPHDHPLNQLPQSRTNQRSRHTQGGTADDQQRTERRSTDNRWNLADTEDRGRAARVAPRDAGADDPAPGARARAHRPV